MTRVTVIGSGYVGLVSGACFAEFGARVSCVDVDSAKIAALNAGQLPIYEPGLAELIASNRKQSRLHFTDSYADAVPGSDLVFIAVGTPSHAKDGRADLSQVHGAAQETARHLDTYSVIVNKSTVPVGAAREVAALVRKANPAAEFDVASNPEFLRQGSAIADFMQPDRVVIGANSSRAAQMLQDLYRPLARNETPMVITSLESAELIKYAANAFLATKVSFINEMAALCEAVGADISAVARGMGLDQRIGRRFLQAGPGYGGSCFPKDTAALVEIARQHDIPCRIANSVIEVNSAQKARMAEKILNALGTAKDKGKSTRGSAKSACGSAKSACGSAKSARGSAKAIAVLGLTFKPETDDMRAAPALSILPLLLEHGLSIRAHDPQGMTAAADLLPKPVQYYDDVYAMCSGADGVVLMTEWNEYRGLDLPRIAAAMSQPVFVDLRNIFEPEQMRTAGFDYHCVGRAP